MTTLRGFLVALGDMDQATPAQGVAICVLLLAVFVAAAMGEGPTP